MTTENPRAEKVAVVEEITAKLNSAEAVFITEYRGMSVGQLAGLRRKLKPAGGEYKVYKNSLVRRAADEAGALVLQRNIDKAAVFILEGEEEELLRNCQHVYGLAVKCPNGGRRRGRTLSSFAAERNPHFCLNGRVCMRAGPMPGLDLRHRRAIPAAAFETSEGSAGERPARHVAGE